MPLMRPAWPSKVARGRAPGTCARARRWAARSNSANGRSGRRNTAPTVAGSPSTARSPLSGCSTHGAGSWSGRSARTTCRGTWRCDRTARCSRCPNREGRATAVPWRSSRYRRCGAWPRSRCRPPAGAPSPTMAGYTRVAPRSTTATRSSRADDHYSATPASSSPPTSAPMAAPSRRPRATGRSGSGTSSPAADRQPASRDPERAGRRRVHPRRHPRRRRLRSGQGYYWDVRPPHGRDAMRSHGPPTHAHEWNDALPGHSYEPACAAAKR